MELVLASFSGQFIYTQHGIYKNEHFKPFLAEQELTFQWDVVIVCHAGEGSLNGQGMAINR
jgi:hypothetical protein